MLQSLSEHWFLTEPALFALYCQQQVEENVRMDCAVRCGQGRLEYNPLILRHKTFAEVEQLMRIELIRLFLKHPYEREPEGCCREAMAIGSDITIADGYCMLHKEKLPLHDPSFYHLPLGQYYEWYAKAIQKQSDTDHPSDRPRPQSDQQPDGQGQPPQPDRQSTQPDEAPPPPADPVHQSTADTAALWRDDSVQRQKINELIERTTDWGSLPADVVERIKASTRARIDRRQIFEGFRSSMLSSQRQLTRMRPNRRTGFLQMGSTRQFDTRLLVAIDVSGSVTEAMLSDFYGSINRLFSYGVVQIDVCQFDAQLGPIQPMQHAQRDIQVTGRGGTSFQPLFDLIQQRLMPYDGLLILTDGQAPPPVVSGQSSAQGRTPTRVPVLWVCHNRQCYDQASAWMLNTGRCCHL